MRPCTGRVYGIPPEKVLGSSFKTRYEMRDGTPLLVLEPQMDLVDDKAGKPVGIAGSIGRRPIAAFGNSDGDLEMLQCATQAGDRRRFGLFVHHTDADANTPTTATPISAASTSGSMRRRSTAGRRRHQGRLEPHLPDGDWRAGRWGPGD